MYFITSFFCLLNKILFLLCENLDSLFTFPLVKGQVIFEGLLIRLESEIEALDILQPSDFFPELIILSPEFLHLNFIICTFDTRLTQCSFKALTSSSSGLLVLVGSVEGYSGGSWVD